MQMNKLSGGRNVTSKVLGGGLAMLVLVGVIAGWTITDFRKGLDSEFKPFAATLSPASGSVAAGEAVTITGSNLEQVTEVRFGGIPAAVKTIDSATITVIAPAPANYAPTTTGVELFSGPQKAATELAFTYVVETPVDRQLSYAFAHWNSYNIASFGDFNAWGGDCQNFVSQTLLARGWVETPEWYNHAQEDWADAFVHVPSFVDWLDSSPEYGTSHLTLDQRDEVKLGDLVVFDWDRDGSLDHIQVVSALLPTSEGVEVKMVGHNVDSDYRDLDRAITVEKPGAAAFFISIP
jgi:hypothetical protein